MRLQVRSERLQETRPVVEAEGPQSRSPDIAGVGDETAGVRRSGGNGGDDGAIDRRSDGALRTRGGQPASGHVTRQLEHGPTLSLAWTRQR